ncbi:hypothetical protein BDP27DRAFT_1421703 [Rhodocollybia butyracea]|uniref:Uncharacterized protein n=1 Tax=Rhodocollybia butyracea TaxID=206335 RepID=A0A9P5PVF7_9AGAR|nr:hypothetical protein BDP27DRAFT_1421703 [Rhodocollybia butyracea]
MAEAKLRALGSEYNAKPASEIPRRRISHRHSQSTPSILPIPALSFSSTSSLRTSVTESTLATPVNSVFNGYIPNINVDSDNDLDEEDELDTPTPTPSPKVSARVQTRIRSVTLVPAGQNSNLKSPSIFRKFSLRSEFSRSLTPPPRAKPSLAMSPEIHQAPRVDSVSNGHVTLTAPKPRRASQLNSPMSLTTYSLPASPLHQTTMLPSSQQQQRPLSRSEHLLRSALLRDEFAQGSSSSHNNPPIIHRRRHSHATSIGLPDNLHISPATAALHTSPSSPSSHPERNTPTPKPRPASPVHTKSAPVTHTMRPHPRSQSYSHGLNAASAMPSTRLPLTPHEQVLRARLERVLTAGGVQHNRDSTRSSGSSSSADDDSLSSHVTYHDITGEGSGFSVDLLLRQKQKSDKKRKRASAPSNGSLFGWLWGTDGQAEEEDLFTLPLPQTPRRRQVHHRDDHEDERKNYSPRTPQTKTLPNSNSSPSLSPYRPGFSGSSSRLRAQTQPLPSSPNRSLYTSSPKPKHAFSLSSVPVGYDIGSGISSARMVASSDGLETTDQEGRMLTPPPTPPRTESVLFGEGLGEVDSPPGSVIAAHETESRNPENLEPTLTRRRDASVVRSDQGRRALGLGRPGARSSGDSASSSSTEGPLAPDITVGHSPDDNDDAEVEDRVRPSRPALSPLFSPTSEASFNARTASLQCKQIDGYVSFASIEGLGEPPASAISLENDGGSMIGDDDRNEGEKKGWVGRLFGR